MAEEQVLTIDVALSELHSLAPGWVFDFHMKHSVPGWKRWRIVPWWPDGNSGLMAVTGWEALTGSTLGEVVNKCRTLIAESQRNNEAEIL